MKPGNLYLDLETYSPIPITNGTWAYAEKAEILLIAYAYEDEPVAVWDVQNTPMPDSLAVRLTMAFTSVWHNGSMFDLPVLSCVLDRIKKSACSTTLVGECLPALSCVSDRSKHQEKAQELLVFTEAVFANMFYDTSVQALEHALPAGLDALCAIFKVPESKRKLSSGKELIRLFCCPNRKGERTYSHQNPEEWALFREYAAHDIEAMRYLHKKMPSWNYKILPATLRDDANAKHFFEEYDLWLLDMRMNREGFCIDKDLAAACVDLLSRHAHETDEETLDISEGVLESTRRRDKTLAFLRTIGVRLPDLTKTTVQRALDDIENLPPIARELLLNRQASTKTSTAKYKRLLQVLSSDNQLRGTQLFCGAKRTGRWSGRLFQHQNLPRGTLGPEELELAVTAIKTGSADLIYSDIPNICSEVLRGSIVPRRGHTFLVADLANIEGRIQAWVAGESWKIKAFEEYDAGIGPDLYLLAYAKAFNKPVASVTPEERSVGKVMELALAYGGGVNAFIVFAQGYHVDLDYLCEGLWRSGTIPLASIDTSKKRIAWMRDNGSDFPDLKEQTILICDVLKDLWRKAHPAIVAIWGNLERALIRASHQEELTRIEVDPKIGLLHAVSLGSSWIGIRKPSGLYLSYPGLRQEGKEISFFGESMNRRWERQRAYGAVFFENVCQSISRDILGSALLRLDTAGYRPVFTVHDEVITEIPDSDTPLCLAEQIDILTSLPYWASGLPLAAKGFQCKRYRKG